MEIETCGEPGDFGLWSFWSGCSASCGGGVNTRSRTHQCTGFVEEDTVICNDICCPKWNQWGEWGPCSVTCGDGTQFRGRDNVCDEIQDQAQTRTCIAVLPDFPYNSWSEWSVCSQSCTGGSTFRSAAHICGGRSAQEVASCGQPGFWLEWSDWSSCSVTCSLGQKSRS